MVIHQFNKLIRNKWIWGAFAIVVGLFFCFDFLLEFIDSSDGLRKDSVGKLGGEEVVETEFRSVAEGIRGRGRNRNTTIEDYKVNKLAWELIAAIRVAKANGVDISDVELAGKIKAIPMFQANGVFSPRAYKWWLAQNDFTDEVFEQTLRRNEEIDSITGVAYESASWVSPMELDREVADRTDVFTVKVAKFTQTEAEAAAVKLDDAALQKWYLANTNSIALPERVKIRFVKYAADDAKVLAKMSVTDDELHDYYDANSELWTVTDTNGVEKVKPFEEVSKEIDAQVRKLAALQYYETNLTTRVYGVTAAKGKSRLDDIAKEDGLKVEVSDYFAIDGAYVEGFMKTPDSILPGADGFVNVVEQLDPAVEDLRYGVVIGADSVWLIERSETSKAHVPSFADAKAVIFPRALADAKLEAFKAKVEAVAKQGVAAVEKTPGISTNYTFSITGMAQGMFPDQYQVAKAVSKLSKGEVSEFTRTGVNTAVLVICVDRKEGDATMAAFMKSQARERIAASRRRIITEQWLEKNLERIGCEPSASASMTPAENTDEE